MLHFPQPPYEVKEHKNKTEALQAGPSARWPGCLLFSLRVAAAAAGDEGLGGILPPFVRVVGWAAVRRRGLEEGPEVEVERQPRESGLRPPWRLPSAPG